MRFTFALVFLLSGSVTFPLRAQSGGCPAQSELSEALRLYVGRLVSGGTALNESIRSGAGLPELDSTSVVVETDSLTCARVTAAVDSAFRRGPRNRSFVVVRAGKSFAVLNPDESSPTVPRMIYFVDSTFTYRRAYTGF